MVSRVAEPFPLDLDTLQRVLDYLNDAVYVTDLDRRIVLWNRRAEEITGYRREEVVGQYCRNAVLSHTDKEGRSLCGTDLCPLRRAIVTATASTAPVLVYALTAKRGRIPVSVSVAPLRDDRGNIVGGIEVFRDESQRLHDLELARRIQQHILPHEMPQSDTLCVAVRYLPRELVGGDFYDVVALEPDSVGILVADVRGHGVSAALYTMVLKSMSQNLAHLAGNPGALLTGMNQALGKLALDEVFATAIYVVVEGNTGVVRYANAGHPPPLLRAADGNVVAFEPEGLPLGVSRDGTYGNLQTRLSPGDTLLLYTDGAVEITDRAGHHLGAEGLARLMRTVQWPPMIVSAGKSSDIHPLDALQEALLRECGGVGFEDDLLLLSCTRLRPSEVKADI